MTCNVYASPVVVDSVFNPMKFPPLGGLSATNGTIYINTGDGATVAPTLAVGSTTNTGYVVTNASGKVVLALFCYSGVVISNGVSCVVTGNLGLVLASQGHMSIGSTINVSGAVGYTTVDPAAAGGNGGPGAESGVRLTTTDSAPPGSTHGAGGGTAVNTGTGYGAAGFECGGGYGGIGGRGWKSDTPIGYFSSYGTSYGDGVVSNLFGGSGGGGTSYGGGGGGGGSLELTAMGTLTIDGVALRANGGNGAGGSGFRPGGGGSGGGVIVAARKIVLSGGWSVQANGGNGQSGNSGDRGGGGGGGRVAFYSDNAFSSQPSGVSVAGGTGPDIGEEGAAGTFRYNGDGGGGILTYPFHNSGTVITLR